jgi:hypothetical protein
MTNEKWIDCDEFPIDEAVIRLKRLDNIVNNFYSKPLYMAIKALEAQPCEDCISRQAVKETIFEQGSAEKLEIDFAKLLLLQRAIKALPSVTPTRPTGRWIVYDVVKFGDFVGTEKYECSKCHHRVGVFKGNFCPNCGAKMEVEDEADN